MSRATPFRTLKSALWARIALLAIGSLVAYPGGAPAWGATPKYAIAIHGGAGTLSRKEMTAEQEASYRNGLRTALDAGYEVLARGGTSLDAVMAAVRILEDDSQFNAGRGAVLTHDGAAELDASIMDGRDLRAGAVAGLRHVKNPIVLARRVMDASPHVFLVGAGAEEFALTQGFDLVPNDYFVTPDRKEQLKRVLSAANTSSNLPMGTVGAVARDAQGHLAAATSTGGMVNKRWGRVGDSPLIGAGTYADDRSCAVSATGHGEYFIRAAVAHDVCARMAYGKSTLAEAARAVVHGQLKSMRAEGGLIAIDTTGRVVMEFNSEGMFRGWRNSEGEQRIDIFR